MSDASAAGDTCPRVRSTNLGVGRFLTPDVLSQSAAGTQGFNRYAYAGNNPVTLSDPSGQSAGRVNNRGRRQRRSTPTDSPARFR